MVQHPTEIIITYIPVGVVDTPLLIKKSNFTTAEQHLKTKLPTQ